MRILLLFLSCLFIAQPVRAENTPPAPSVVTADFDKALKHASTGRVDAVIDAQTIMMKDGKILRLLGIDYPFMAGDTGGGPAIAAKSRLEKLLPEGTEVMLWQTRDQKIPRVSRMGHILAHLVVKKNDEWINGTLVREGLAWTVTDLANPQMAARLYTLEDEARKAGKGLWGKNSPFGVLTPETASQGNGTFRIVEGTVNRAATTKNNLYLNFGTDWKRDFTVMIPPALRKTLAKNGVDPMNLAGTKIRVRGWLREYNGPFMELETAERVEILSKPSPTDLPTTGQSIP